ncbi:MAG TPA: P1 family peptidase [Puia sp.]|jgi:L-aminopeptidase/D-esterase-like protein|nr:P1 family peptidase [Puia sp.]
MRILLYIFAACCGGFVLMQDTAAAQATVPVKRARDYGVPFDGSPGVFNAITDVPGVTVGETTIIRGDGPLVRGQGPVRTGVTAILPRGAQFDPVYANWYTLNGNGDMTGTHWITESGFLETPILITNTGSVGTVRDAAWQWMDQHHYYTPFYKDYWYAYPVVAETYDGIFNDINGQHVTKQDALRALDSANSGPVPEGGVGGGTGMMCYGFKGGTGTASRVLSPADGGYTVGVLVQCNHGSRPQLTIAGVPVGKALKDTLPYRIEGQSFGVTRAPAREETGSIIVVLATNAPLLPGQLKRLAQRIPLGVTRTGGIGGNGSGDIFIAFSTANPHAFSNTENRQVTTLSNDRINPLLAATIEATEEAIVNALFAGQTLTGINGNTVYGLPKEAVLRILRKYNRLGK